MNTKHAVLMDTLICSVSDEKRGIRGDRVERPFTHVSQLWEEGQRLGVSHFWIMPGSEVDKQSYDFLADIDGFNIFVPLAKTEDKPEFPRAARCYKEGASGTHQIIVGYPGRDPFDWKISHPLDILACIDYLEQVISGIIVEYSPQAIGKQKLKTYYNTTNRLQSYLTPAKEVDLKELPFYAAAPEIMFLKPFTANMEGEYIHFYDKNTAHPSAARSMDTGYGDPTHVIGGDITVNLPGIYRVSFDKKTSVFDGLSLPLIIASEWITRDVVRFARKWGYEVTIHEAWLFENSHRFFDRWVADLWEARQALKDQKRFFYEPGRVNAYNTLKNIMNKTISAQKDHINWWSDMVGAARVVRCANLATFAMQGSYPRVIYYDDMAYTSLVADPSLAVYGILARKDEIGGYKHQYSFLLNAQMVQDCMKFTRPNQVLAYFKKLAKEEGLI